MILFFGDARSQLSCNGSGAESTEEISRLGVAHLLPDIEVDFADVLQNPVCPLYLPVERSLDPDRIILILLLGVHQNALRACSVSLSSIFCRSRNSFP